MTKVRRNLFVVVSNMLLSKICEHVKLTYVTKYMVKLLRNLFMQLIL